MTDTPDNDNKPEIIAEGSEESIIISASESCDENDKSCKNKKCCNKGLMAFLLVVLVLIGFGVFSSRLSINKGAVESKISSIVEVLAKKAELSGKTLTLTYDKIDINGGLFSKKIIINKPVIAISGEEYSDVTISMEKVELNPDSSTLEKNSFSISSPIIISSPNKDESIIKITEFHSAIIGDGSYYELLSTTGFTGNLEQKNNGDLAYNIELPKEAVMSFIAKDGERRKKFSVSAAAGAITTSIDAETGQYITSVSGNDVVFENNRGRAAMAAIVSSFHSINEGVTQIKKYNANISNIMLSAPYNLFGEMNVSIAAEKEFSSNKDDAAENKLVRYNVNDFTVAFGDSSLNFSGELSKEKGELIPLGEALLKIKGKENIIAMLQSSSILSGRTAGAIEGIIDEIGVEKNDALEITLERRNGESFLLGGTSFEEVIALAIKQYFAGNEPTPTIAEKLAVEQAEGLANENTVEGGGDKTTDVDNSSATVDGNDEAIEGNVEDEAETEANDKASVDNGTNEVIEGADTLTDSVEKEVIEELEKSGINIDENMKEDALITDDVPTISEKVKDKAKDAVVEVEIDEVVKELPIKEVVNDNISDAVKEKIEDVSADVKSAIEPVVTH